MEEAQNKKARRSRLPFKMALPRLGRLSLGFSCAGFFCWLISSGTIAIQPYTRSKLLASLENVLEWISVLLIVIGLLLLFIGFLIGFIALQNPTGQLGLSASILTLTAPVIIWRWFPELEITSQWPLSFEIILWFLSLAVVLVVTVRRSRWAERVKTMVVFIVTVCVLSLFALQARRMWQSSFNTATAIHMTGDEFNSTFEKPDEATYRRFNHKLIVVTGIVYGQDSGLIGSDPQIEPSDIEFHNLPVGDSVNDGQKVSIIGECQITQDALIQDALINVYNCHIVKRFGNGHY